MMRRHDATKRELAEAGWYYDRKRRLWIRPLGEKYMAAASLREALRIHRSVVKAMRASTNPDPTETP